MIFAMDDLDRHWNGICSVSTQSPPAREFNSIEMQETGLLRARLWQAWLYAKFTFLGGAFPGAVEQAGPRDESQHLLADDFREI